MNIAVIILAAGYSSRMGVLKPLLPVGGVTAVRRCADTARAVGAETIIVVTGYRGGEVAEEFTRDDRVIFAHNDSFNAGMFSSIVCGVAALPSGLDGFFLFPVDYCAVSSDTLRAQLCAFDDAGREPAVFSFMDGHRGHPPLLPACLIPKFADYSGDGGLKRFLEPYPQLRVPLGDLGAFLDMDTPDDYAALLSHLNLPVYPDRAACGALLSKYDTPRDIAEHGKQVADLAIKIARLMTDARLDTELLYSACLLHDIARHLPEHDKAGAALLLREGYPKAAILVSRHMDGAAERAADASEIAEADLLFLADKLSRRGRTVPLALTIAQLSDRFPPGSEAHSAAVARMTRADELLSMLFEAYGFGYAELIGDTVAF